MKNSFKRIIAVLICAAIMATGISMDCSNTTTAHAAMTYEQYMGNTINIADYKDTPFTILR